MNPFAHLWSALAAFLSVFFAILLLSVPVPAQDVKEKVTDAPAAKDAEEKPADPKNPAPKNTRSVVMLGKKAGEERLDNNLMLKFCWCPAGKFLMGSPPEEPGRQVDEKQVEVNLSRGFWLGKYEITQAQWRKLMETEPWQARQYVTDGPNNAATFISWNDARAFCRKLTETEQTAGRLPKIWTYTLPTEAQWEYACRAGSKSAFSFGNDENLLRNYGWFAGNQPEVDGEKAASAQKFGLKKGNAWGLFDMHGNVWEWCLDSYSERLPGGTDPESIGKGVNHITRGGSWTDDAPSCRSAYRHYQLPGSKNSYLGFRIALVSTAAEKPTASIRTEIP